MKICTKCKKEKVDNYFTGLGKNCENKILNKIKNKTK